MIVKIKKYRRKSMKFLFKGVVIAKEFVDKKNWEFDGKRGVTKEHVAYYFLNSQNISKNFVIRDFKNEINAEIGEEVSVEVDLYVNKADIK
jgi:hypothetical protein